MYLIFDILETPFKSCNKVLLSPNKSGTTEFSGVPLIIETSRQVQITCQEAKLSAIYLASVVEPATNLYFVLLKQIALRRIVNMYLQIDFGSTRSKV